MVLTTDRVIFLTVCFFSNSNSWKKTATKRCLVRFIYLFICRISWARRRLVWGVVSWGFLLFSTSEVLYLNAGSSVCAPWSRYGAGIYAVSITVWFLLCFYSGLWEITPPWSCTPALVIRRPRYQFRLKHRLAEFAFIYLFVCSALSHANIRSVAGLCFFWLLY